MGHLTEVANFEPTLRLTPTAFSTDGITFGIDLPNIEPFFLQDNICLHTETLKRYMEGFKMFVIDGNIDIFEQDQSYCGLDVDSSIPVKVKRENGFGTVLDEADKITLLSILGIQNPVVLALLGFVGEPSLADFAEKIGVLIPSSGQYGLDSFQLGFCD